MEQWDDTQADYRQRSWLAATIDFYRDGRESKILKAIPWVVLGFGPADEWIPIAGQLDDIPTLLLAGVTAPILAYRINKHR